jgi:hypothetical protein
MVMAFIFRVSLLAGLGDDEKDETISPCLEGSVPFAHEFL